MQSVRVPKPGLPKIPELLLRLLLKILSSLFGPLGPRVSNIDFVKVLEIELIFFYFVFGMVNVKILVSTLHSLSGHKPKAIMSDLFYMESV